MSLDDEFQSALKVHQGQQFGAACKLYRKILARQPDHLPTLINLGQALRAQGDVTEALKIYRRAADIETAGYEVWYNLGNLQLAQGTYAEAARSYDIAAAHKPDFAPAYFQNGLALRHQGKLVEALSQFRRALDIEPSLAKAHMNAGNTLRALGQTTAAIDAHRQALSLTPQSWEVHYNLARALLENGDDAGYRRHFEQAQNIAPDPTVLHVRMGDARFDSGDLDAANTQYHLALQQNPAHLQALLGLAQVNMRTGRTSDALTTFSNATKRCWSNAGELADLATILWSYKLWHEAAAILERIAELRPEQADSYTNLARAYGHLWRIQDALNACTAAIKLEPDNFLAMQLRGVNLVKRGQVDDGLAAFRNVARLQPNDEDNFASELFSSLYSDELSAADVAALHRERTAKFAPTNAADTLFENIDRDADRRLKIGYLSPDFKGQHPVSLFLEPILRHHDQRNIERFCYSSVDAIDQTTREFTGLCDHWQEVYGWPDARLAQQIRDDKIDILVDLAGHTAGNRLKCLAMRPAPIQMCFIGYPHSTGLTAVDYLIADPVVCPPEYDHLCSEEVIRLNDCVFCFPMNHDAPPVNENRAFSSSTITFGSFNNVPKLTPSTVDLWSRLLLQIPQATLRLKAAPFTDADTRERYFGMFEDNGVERRRIDIVGPTPLYDMMGEYDQIDIALDPVPYNGGTTTFQALWMGVPVITLAGENFCSRMSASIYASLGLTDYVAKSPDEYVDIAARLADNPNELAQLRGTLRTQLMQSPLCDAETYTHDLEEKYRQVWQRWCQK